MTSTLQPPGPRGGLLLGSLPEFARDRLAFFTRCARDYGDVVRYRFGHRRILQFNHPDAIEEVLVTQHPNFIKHFALRLNTLLLGKGLLTSEGEFWLRQRRLAQPAFVKQRVLGYAGAMVEYADRLAASWYDGRECDLVPEMNRLTLEITARTLFGAEAGSEAATVSAALAEAMSSFSRRINSLFLFPRWLPTPANLRLHRGVRNLDRVIYRFIDERRRSGQEQDDLLSRLLHARDVDGSRMTDKQLRDEAMTIFLAGHETTALALSWTWYLLSQHPSVETKLHAELDRVLAGRLPTAADLTRLGYVEQVILEAMRLYPPAYTLGREAIRDCTIAGCHVPRGTTVFMCQWVIQRDPRWFERPDEFDPDRWAGGLAQRIPKFAYFPFGGGPRLCIGNTFAMLEMVLVLATLAQRYRFCLVPGHEVKPWPSVTLRLTHGLKGTLHRR